MKQLSVLAVAIALISGAAQAATTSFTGTFAADNDVAQVDFTLAEAGRVTLTSFGYGGGTLADGTVIAAGGFDPILSLYSADSGHLLNFNDDGGTAVNADPVTGARYDPFLSITLQAGRYTAVLTQFFNFPAGASLLDGFRRDGAQNGAFTAMFGCAQGQFCDSFARSRSADWALEITTPDMAGPSVIPLPGGLPLLLSGIVGLFWWRRRTSA